MAVIQSNGTGGGDWDAGATWDGGSVPGVGDDAQIVSGDTVTVNVNQTTDSFAALTIDDGGHLQWATGGTYELHHSGTATVNGQLTMDGTGASSKLTWYAGGQRTIGSTATIELTGRTKDIAAMFTQAPDGTYVYVDDGAGADVSGWEVNDYIAAVHGVADRDQITADGGWDGTEHTYTCGLNSSLPANGRVINLTRSVVIESGTDDMCVVDDAATITDLSYVEMLDERWGITALTGRFEGCSWRDTLASNSTTCGLEFETGPVDDMCAYMQGSNTHRTPNLFYQTGGSFEDISIERLYILFANNTYAVVCVGAYHSTVWTFRDCEVARGQLLEAAVRETASMSARDCYIWGSDVALEIVFIGRLCNVSIGADKEGNTEQVTTGLSCTGPCYVVADNCLLNAATPISLTDVDAEHSRVISTQHDQTSGARYEPQEYGSSEQVIDADFDGGVADEIDPSSDTDYFLYRVVFPCDSGKTPTLTIYQEETESSGHGIDTVQVELGDRRCGLSGINTGDTITPSGTRAQHDITFTGTTDCKGEVEVIMKIRDDDATGGGVLHIGDISVSGNL